MKNQKITIGVIIPGFIEPIFYDSFSSLMRVNAADIDFVFSESAKRWKSVSDLSVEGITEGYNELLARRPKYILVFGDDACRKLADAVDANIVVSNKEPYIVTVLSAQHISSFQNFQFWFSQKNELHHLYNFFHHLTSFSHLPILPMLYLLFLPILIIIKIKLS